MTLGNTSKRRRRNWGTFSSSFEHQGGCRGLVSTPPARSSLDTKNMAHTGPILEGRGKTDYERYVRVPELLELQKPVAELSHPEERLFQITHQAAELCLHPINYAIARPVAFLPPPWAARAPALLPP